MNKMRRATKSVAWAAAWALAALASGADQPVWKAKDLNPVTFKEASRHDPVVLVENGMAKASIVEMAGAVGAAEIQKYIEQATGASLPIVKNKITPPAIVLGDCAEAAALGLIGKDMPPEGFAIKTAPGLVFIAGNNMAGGPSGLQWGVYEFLERYVGMRWYFPSATEKGPEIGMDIPKSNNLIVESVWLEDAPVFRLRVICPPCSVPWLGRGINLTPLHTFLRSANSWPIQVMVHTPRWRDVEDFKKNRPEIYQLKADGARDYSVLCYSNPKTLKTYLEQIQNMVDKKPHNLGISGKAITVSPADVQLACYCKRCRKLWDKDGGQYGSASKVMTGFVDNLAREIQKRWPQEGFTVIFLPYLNYSAAPDGFKFPGNVEVQLCGMPGMASYKEPAIRDSEQANIDKWIAISGRKIQNWHYCCWPAHKTSAAYQYPHVVKDFYIRNRDKTVGSLINGEFNHWPRQHISLYCWLKCLWNPAYDVDAAVDAFCERMFGPAGRTMRELIGMQMDRWEKSEWPGGRFSPKGIYEVSFPHAEVVKMEALFRKAREEAKNDPQATARLDYYEPALADFFKESKDLDERTGFQNLHARKVEKNPRIDGKLDDASWERATANSFVVAAGAGRGKKPKYPTAIKAVWTSEGITLGFRMEEPAPQLMNTTHGGHDNGELWWDDNVEIFLDVTGRNEGAFYQIIVNPDIAVYDSKLKDITWECKGMTAKSQRDKDSWSLEVFLPYSAFEDAVKPDSGSLAVWTGSFTRHRVADSMKENKLPDSAREYTRMNTTGSTSSDNLLDFARIIFEE